MTAQPCDASVITTDANSPLEQMRHLLEAQRRSSEFRLRQRSDFQPVVGVSSRKTDFTAVKCASVWDSQAAPPWFWGFRAVEDSEFPTVPKGARRPRSSERHFRKNFSLDPSATREKSFSRFFFSQVFL